MDDMSKARVFTGTDGRIFVKCVECSALIHDDVCWVELLSDLIASAEYHTCPGVSGD
jgi:hypothetical protein